MRRIFFVIGILWLCMSAWPRDAKAIEALKIGILQEPKTLNVWMATDTWSSKILSLIYPPLFLRDPETHELVPWLAEDKPVYDPKEKSYKIRLRELRWSDGSSLTSEDVVFTGNTILRFKIPNLYNRWDLISKIESVDERTVKFYMKEPSPLFESRTLSSPVVQKKEWEGIIKSLDQSGEALKTLLNQKVREPVSIGPFVVSDVKEGAYIFLKPNPYFKKEFCSRPIGPHLKGIIFKIFGTTDTAVLELKKGGLDYIWWNLPEGYLADLERVKGVKVFTSDKNALYFLGFNLQREPMKELAFRKAVASLVDKEFLLTRLLQNKGVVMDSVISPGNKQWYCQDVTKYSHKLSRQERIREAYALLKEAGYSWKVPPIDEKGRIQKGQGIVMPTGKPMQAVTILVPPADYDPVRAMAGTMIQEWLQEIGMPVSARPMPFNALIEQVKTRKDFDMVIMGYGNLSLDPDYMRRFFESETQGHKGDNITGYASDEFDRLAKASARCMDKEERKRIVFQMQKLLSEELPVIPLYNPYVVEAVREDRFRGWVPTIGGVGNLWSFLNLTQGAKGK